jgi:chorismate-pyruvate lyase
MTRVSWLLGLAAALCWPAFVGSREAAPSVPEWLDTPLARVEALALIETLNAELLTSSSATQVLERWCREHALAEPALIEAHRIESAQQAPSSTVRQDLQLRDGEAVRYRRVELSCGARVLSVAENWYVPDRLTDAMNRELEQTQTPFGKVVQPLHPHRETLAARMLWSPLPAGWETRPAAVRGSPADRMHLPAALFEHRAVLYASEHRAIAEVDEVYQRDLLAFPEPQWP